MQETDIKLKTKELYNLGYSIKNIGKAIHKRVKYVSEIIDEQDLKRPCFDNGIISDYNKGISINRLSEKYQKGKKYIKTCLERNNILITNHFLNDNQIANILKCYKNNQSVRKISMATGTAPQTIFGILKKNNIKIKHQLVYSIIDVDEKYIIDKYQAGTSALIISKKLKVSENKIFRVLKKNNIEVRDTTGFHHRKHMYASITKEILEYWYITKKLTHNQIAIKLNAPEIIISRLCRDYEIQSRTVSEYGIGISSYEQELYDFISSINNNVIIKNDRSTLNGIELDIFIPELKLAIEFNGTYWHSDKFKQQKYHQNKYLVCLDEGIRLIQIWEHDWLTQKDKILTLIKSAIKSDNIKIGARKCKIVNINRLIANKFCDNYHIQGSGSSSINIGLLYDNELIQIMTFRKNSGNKWLIDRLCTKHGYSVVGGANRLFVNFIGSINPLSVVSYSANDLFTGKVYEKLGFINDGLTVPRMFYIKDGVKHNRQKFQKHKLVKQGFDIKLSSTQIMDKLKYLRIFDSGNTKWTWRK